MVVAYKWGGIAFDDYAAVKHLVLPSNADEDAPVTFHDEAGNNYQVPSGKVFIAGKIIHQATSQTEVYRIGESASADGALAKVRIRINVTQSVWNRDDIMGVFDADTYVTCNGTANLSSQELKAESSLDGVEITI